MPPALGADSTILYLRARRPVTGGMSQGPMTDSATGAPATTASDRLGLARLADGTAAAVAVSLPWSTSATGILVAVWLVALLATLDLAMLRREITTPAGGAP